MPNELTHAELAEARRQVENGAIPSKLPQRLLAHIAELTAALQDTKRQLAERHRKSPAMRDGDNVLDPQSVGDTR